MDYALQDENLIDYHLRLDHLSTAGNFREKSDRLNAFYIGKKLDGFKLLVCDICGAYSLETQDSCPFCGDGGVSSATPIQRDLETRSVYGVSELDAMVSTILSYSVSASKMWHVGRVLSRIRTGGLWRLRRQSSMDDRSPPKYKTFSEWLNTETPFTNRTALRLMRISECFPRDRAQKEILPNLAGMAERRFIECDDRPEAFDKLPPLRNDEKEGLVIAIPDDKNNIVTVLEKEDGSKALARIPDVLVRRKKARLCIHEGAAGETIRLSYGIEKLAMKSRTNEQPASSADDDPYAELELSPSMSMLIKVVKNRDGNLEAICETKKKRLV